MQVTIQKIATEIQAIASIDVGSQSYIYASGLRLTLHQGRKTLSVTVAPDIIGYMGDGHTIEFTNLGDLEVNLHRLDAAIGYAFNDTIADHEATIARLKKERDTDPVQRVNYDAKTNDFIMCNGNTLRVIASYPDAILCESVTRSYNMTYNTLRSHGAFYIPAPKTWNRVLEC